MFFSSIIIEQIIRYDILIERGEKEKGKRSVICLGSSLWALITHLGHNQMQYRYGTISTQIVNNSD